MESTISVKTFFSLPKEIFKYDRFAFINRTVGKSGDFRIWIILELLDKVNYHDGGESFDNEYNFNYDRMKEQSSVLADAIIGLLDELFVVESVVKDTEYKNQIQIFLFPKEEK